MRCGRYSHTSTAQWDGAHEAPWLSRLRACMAPLQRSVLQPFRLPPLKKSATYCFMSSMSAPCWLAPHAAPAPAILGYAALGALPISLHGRVRLERSRHREQARRVGVEGAAEGGAPP